MMSLTAPEDLGHKTVPLPLLPNQKSRKPDLLPDHLLLRLLYKALDARDNSVRERTGPVHESLIIPTNGTMELVAAQTFAPARLHSLQRADVRQIYTSG